MLVINIEFWRASKRDRVCIGRLVITNDGSSTNPKRSDYDVFLGRRRERPILSGQDALEVHQAMENPLRTGKVRNYPRLSYNVWRLVIRALLAVFPEEARRLPDKESA